MIDIGQEIKYRRLKLGLSQQALADATGNTKAYVSNLERGVKSPSLDTLQPFIEALGGEIAIKWRSKKASSTL